MGGWIDGGWVGRWVGGWMDGQWVDGRMRHEKLAKMKEM